MTSDKINIKKEVSCKALTAIFNAANEKNIDLNKITAGVPYNITYLLNKRERIEWNIWCKIISNSRRYFAPSEFVKMGEDYVKSQSYIEGYIFTLILFSSGRMGKILKNQIFKAAHSMCSCINQETTFIGQNRVKVEAYLNPEHENCPEFFYISKGVWEKLGNQIGQKEFNVDLTITSRGAIFDVSWKKERLLVKINKRIRWFFNIRSAFTELAKSHEELLDQYKNLEESRELLQKKTTLLNSANNITRYVRHSSDINKTLHAINSVLINDARFSFVQITLFKDVDENELNIEVSDGVPESNVTPIRHPLIKDDEKIGELLIYPKTGSHPDDVEELLNHLLPVIILSIHDTLVLRIITDYKNNLETKVKNRTAELNKVKERLSETIKLLKEAQEAKNRFFTNISHEFRTPLTLILGPSKRIIESTQSDNIRDDAKLIYRSAKKLNRLADQLLDISIIKAGRMKMKFTNENIVPFIFEIVSSFRSFAEKKNISLKFNPEQDEIFIYIDRDKIDKILSNILSNALKFTPTEGNVTIEVKKACLDSLNKYDNFNFGKETAGLVEISVTDTGIGISREQINKIFDRFYQVDNSHIREYEGAGIGLSLTKELVRLHKGKIVVESEEGKGSSFKIFLPVLLAGEISQEDNEPDSAEMEYEFYTAESFSNIDGIKTENDSWMIGEDEKPLILIVEDNRDLRDYISKVLGKFYNIIEAVNGKEGIEISIKRIPDLIISDIMMPGFDGIQLCKFLKSDAKTSHIPIILLTAKSRINDKIEGLETGADDYIVKPFHVEELKARIQNLLAQRKRVREYFRTNGPINFDEKRVTPVDEQFLNRVFSIINAHIKNTDFNVEKFAEELTISRSLLHKKLIALTGESPGELLKRIRLDRSKKLIESEFGNITEIAFEVGFSDASYFTACFKKQYGVSPTQYHNQCLNPWIEDLNLNSKDQGTSA